MNIIKNIRFKPKTIYKTVDEVLVSTSVADARGQPIVREKREQRIFSALEREEMIDRLETEMREAAKNLAFERAAQLRNEVEKLKIAVKVK